MGSIPIARGWAIASVVFTAGLASSCTNESSDSASAPKLAPSTPAPRLAPPREFVVGPDDTPLTLEQAGILTPDGRSWAKVLGKALFWDLQAGSDDNACASCHYSAGADPRIRNQLSPGFNDVASGPGGDSTFGSIESDTGEVAAGRMPSGAPAGANYELTRDDFPLLELHDKRDRNSPIRTETNDAVASQGAFAGTFTSIGLGGQDDRCSPSTDVFEVAGLAARQVEPRNTPTTINAAFFHRNFWDGRANNTFNGVGVFGMRDIAGDPNKRLVVFENGIPSLGYLAIKNASLASQAVGPPLSVLEMSCDHRTFADVGRRLLTAQPLFRQHVSTTDSLLGPYVNASGLGLSPLYTYARLIQKAFDPKYWSAPGRYRIVQGELVPDGTGYTQMEINFSMFWGIAIMLYEKTLISDQSRFDDWFESCRPAITNPSPTTIPIGNPVVTCTNPSLPSDPTAHGFTAQEAMGFALFNAGGRGVPFRGTGNPACIACHPIANPTAPLRSLFSEAAFQEGQLFVPVERSRVDDPGYPLAAVIEGGTHDRGFFNLGLRPATTDLGAGGNDPYGNPLSIGRLFLREQAGQAVVDPTGIVDRCNTPTLLEPGGTPPYPGCPSTPPAVPPLLDAQAERHLVDGTFKTPSLRNVALTPPYFHYGGYSDLRSVIDVYARGGSKRNMLLTVPESSGDWSGTGRNGSDPVPSDGPVFGTNVDFFVHAFQPTDEQIDALVAFMLTLTDPRVQCDVAPFDHPELIVHDGHSPTDQNHDGEADDLTFVLPAVGATGYTGDNARYCVPNAGDLFAPGLDARRVPRLVP